MGEKICLTICLLIAILVLGCNQTEQEVHSGEDVMQNVTEGYDSISGIKGAVVFRREEVSFEEKNEFWLMKDGPYKYRTEYDDITTVSNGSVTIFVFGPIGRLEVVSESFNELNKSRKGDLWAYAPREDLYWWVNKVTPREPVPHLSGEEEVAGRDCYVIDMYSGQVNQSEEPYSKLWIDKEYWYPLKIQFDTIVY